MIKILAKQRMFIEVKEILKYMDIEFKNKIPFRILRTIEILGVGEYKFVYDKTKPLNEQKICNDTKDMISYLYIKYYCDATKKKEIQQILKENHEKLVQLDREKNWLLNRKYEEEEKEKVTETALVKVDKESVFSKIILKIKRLFSKK